jgi:hypothetical protein
VRLHLRGLQAHLVTVTDRAAATTMSPNQVRVIHIDDVVRGQPPGPARDGVPLFGSVHQHTLAIGISLAHVWPDK